MLPMARRKVPPRRSFTVTVTKARTQFAQVLALARRGDVAITRGRRIVAYVVSAARYRQLVSGANENTWRANVFAVTRKLFAAAAALDRTPFDHGLVARLTALLLCAARTFQDFDYAVDWIREPNARLGNRTPRDVAGTEGGTHVVLNLLAALGGERLEASDEAQE